VSNAKGNNDIYFDISFGINLSLFITSQSTSDPGNDSHPSWHPSGDYLAFTTNRNGKAEIYLVNLSNNLLDEEFLFTSKFQKEPLIQMSERHAYDPEYSPDGTLVAFTSRLVSGDGLVDIYINNLDTGENTNITNTDMTQIGQHDWSPDGSKLIFRADPDATNTYHPSQLEIFTINKDGSNLVQITNNEKLDASPKWSNDGASIYFVSHENQEKPKIYVMDTDGSNVKRVTSFSSSIAEFYFDIHE
jgi:Tol biopolymer transport system component